MGRVLDVEVVVVVVLDDVGGLVSAAPQTVQIVGWPWHASLQSGHQFEDAGIVMTNTYRVLRISGCSGFKRYYYRYV